MKIYLHLSNSITKELKVNHIIRNDGCLILYRDDDFYCYLRDINYPFTIAGITLQKLSKNQRRKFNESI